LIIGVRRLSWESPFQESLITNFGPLKLLLFFAKLMLMRVGVRTEQSWNLYSYAGNNPLYSLIQMADGRPCRAASGKCWEAQKGDTLETLAPKLHVSVNKLTKFFSTVDPNNIQVGQVFDLSCLNCNATPVTVIDLGSITGIVDPPARGPSSSDKAAAAIGIAGAIALGGTGGGTAAGGTATGILGGGFILTQAALEHIILRHWPTSGHNTPPAGKFSPGTTARDLRNMIDEAVHNSRPTPDRNNGQRFEYDFGRIIGKTSKGVPTSKIRVVLDAAGRVRTAFPIR